VRQQLKPGKGVTSGRWCRQRDGETRVASEQIQRGCKQAMETRATAIKAGRRHHKWAMVQATATVMYRKGSFFYNSIINKDGPRMLARRHDNNEQQFESPPSSNIVSLRRISFFLEIHSPRSVTPFFCQNSPFPPKSNKTAPAAKPLSACLLNNYFSTIYFHCNAQKLTVLLILFSERTLD
jgi:hypothetical protein